MDRRRPPRHSDPGRSALSLALRVVLLPVMVALVLAAGTATPMHVVASAPPDDAPSTTALDNDFIPAERNLTDCIGVLQRPGCGSEARGGWRQTLVFVAVAAGLVVVFWRVRVNVLRNRRSA